MKVVTDIESGHSPSSAEGKNALPGMEGILRKYSVHQLDFGADVLSKSLEATLREVVSTLERADVPSDAWDIGEVNFSLSITTSGEFALLSVAKGAQDTGAGISFKLVRKS